MPQLYLYVPDDLAEEIRRRAEAQGTSASRFLCELVRREIRRGWPEGFFEKVPGKWRGKPLERPHQGAFEERKRF